MNKLKVLLVTNSSSDRINHIVNAFEDRDDLKLEVLHQYEDTIKKTFFIKLFNKFRIPLDSDHLNKRLLKKIDSFHPDIIFIIKGNVIYPWTLSKIKKNNLNTKIISWSLDDMYALHNRSRFYTNGLQYYDNVFTTKSYNIKELKLLGAEKIEFLYQAFSKKYHKKSKNCLSVKYKADVLFIGFAELERFNTLNYLAENGIKIEIFGSNWHKKEFKNYHKNLTIHPFDLIGDDYSNEISCSKISLCFLRKVNRDLHTSRSIEIPACGGFMIAERTDEHLQLFEENKEAVYFESDAELLKKIKYYLENDSERILIAENGYKKCIEEDYSYDNMIDKILKKVYNES